MAWSNETKHDGDEKDVPVELIYLGACTLSDGKKGARWITRQAFDACKDETGVDPVELVRRVASAYGAKTAKNRSIGAIYSTVGTVENKIATTAHFGQMQFVGRVDHPVIQAFEAIDIAAKDEERSRRASNTVKNDPLITRELNATIVKIRKLPMRQRVAIVDAIRSELLNRALAGRD